MFESLKRLIETRRLVASMSVIVCMSCDKHFAYCSQSVNESNEHGRVTRTQPAEKNVNVIVFDARQKRLYILQGAEGKNGTQEQEKKKTRKMGREERITFVRCVFLVRFYDMLKL